ncbi:drug resistance transporter, EmrB/QacA subfamily [Paenibacillus sp. 1_12]|uniref:MDR family MFS transporter n=1 Tax=Paenibacillus sp. 1_12 TaxID=1566278 RepID=UPI0008E89E2F|nr:MDR family MFS transporter [Paenibacillus sp. 1_12]SFM30653.1 drug resistance transporter, EmrB/QacA subfamily [Paenibacillus sp. 1_12]
MSYIVQRGNTNRRYVMTAVVIATFLTAIEGTIVNTAVPVIVGELGGLGMMSWVVSIYLLTTAVSTPISGKIADLYGRKPVFILGTALFLLGSILCGMAQSMEQLILFRALQGFGAGAILPVTITIVGDLYPFEERAKAQGWISSIWGISAVSSPLSGGLLVDYVSWRWIFYINVPFGIVSLSILSLYFRESLIKEKKHIDFWGMFVFTLGMASFMYALLTLESMASVGSSTILVCFGATVVFLAIFIVIERKSPDPMLQLKLFRQRMIGVPNLSDFVFSAVLVAINVYIPLWVQGVYGHGAVFSGLMLIPVSVFWPLGAYLAGRMIARFGMRSTSLTGIVCTIIACAGMALPALSTSPWLLVLCLVLIGFGFGLTFTVHTVSVQSAVDWNLRGSAIASNNFIRMMGQSIGVALFGILLNGGVSRYLAGGGKGADLSGMDVNQALNPQASSILPPEVLQNVREALSSGLHNVFIVLILLSSISFVVTLWLPQRHRSSEHNLSPSEDRGKNVIY